MRLGTLLVEIRRRARTLPPSHIDPLQAIHDYCRQAPETLENRTLMRITRAIEDGRGDLWVATDGGGLCSNHPGNRGGLTKVLEAVRQLRGEAHPKVQVKNCDLALAHGTGGSLGLRHGSATVILERE